MKKGTGTKWSPPLHLPQQFLRTEDAGDDELLVNDGGPADVDPVRQDGRRPGEGTGGRGERPSRGLYTKKGACSDLDIWGNIRDYTQCSGST